jgi:hypothetical protein
LLRAAPWRRAARMHSCRQRLCRTILARSRSGTQTRCWALDSKRNRPRRVGGVRFALGHHVLWQTPGAGLTADAPIGRAHRIFGDLASTHHRRHQLLGFLTVAPFEKADCG